jgi:NTE family protein
VIELRQVPLFATLPPARLAELALAARPRSVAAGEVLFECGDPGDALFLVRSGRLEVLVDGAVVRVHGRGEVFGELASLTGGARTATVRARRDSELLAVRRADLDALLAEPAFARALVRHLAERLPGRARPAAQRGTVLALVPFDAGASALVRALADRLTAALSALTPTARLTVDHGESDVPARRVLRSGMVSPPSPHGESLVSARRGAHSGTASCTFPHGARGWPALLDAAESEHDVVLLVADRPDDEWARFCLRQAERPLVVVDGSATPRPRSLPAPAQLVVAGGTAGPWIRTLAPANHHLVGRDLPAADVSRLARRVSGRSVGLVLSGGGARGLAHIGVLDELGRAGITVDRVGGTSMGAVVAGLVATGAGPAEMVDAARRELVARRPFGDVTWPRHALVRGTRMRGMLRRVFGDARVEDQRCALFTVSVDLVAAEEVVHRSGRIADAVALSARLPGITPPVRIGRRLHVDGGVLDNLPIGVMAGDGEGPVIAVDVAQPFGAGAGTLPGIVDTIGRSMTLGSWRRADPDRTLARTVIVPELGDLGMFDFARLDELVERGRRAGRAAAAELPDLRAA